MGKNKFYAVRRGRSTGIFTDWPSCEAAVRGFAGAQFKGFPTKAEAEAYLSAGGGQPAAPSAQQQQQPSGYGAGGQVAAAGGQGSTKFYAIIRGHNTGVFQGAWNQIKPLVDGFPGALYKGFSTRQAAEQHYRSSSSSMAGSSQQTPAAAAAAAAAAAGGGPSSLAGSKRPYSDIDSSRPPPPAFSAAAEAAGAAPPPAAAAAAGPGMAQQQQQQQQQQQGELQVTVYFDGGSRGNPGRAGYGYAIFDRHTGERLRIGCRPLVFGSTNNEAEYTGMIEGLRFAAEHLRARHVVVKGDSQLAVRQMKGEYRVTADKIKPLYREAKMLADRFNSFEIQHVYRDENAVADTLSNIAMDSDEVVEALGKGEVGAGSRRAAALALIHACQFMDQETGGPLQDVLDTLLSSGTFLEGACHFLAKLWDQEVEVVAAKLTERGWDQHTGGPPELLPGGSAAGGLGRGQATVAVAAVSLGPQWAGEIRRQEQLMQEARSNHHHQQQQQQQQQQQRQHKQQRQRQASREMGFGLQFLTQSQAHRRQQQQVQVRAQAQQQVQAHQAQPAQQQQPWVQQQQQQQQQQAQAQAPQQPLAQQQQLPRWAERQPPMHSSSTGGGGSSSSAFPAWRGGGAAGGRAQQQSSSSSSRGGGRGRIYSDQDMPGQQPGLPASSLVGSSALHMPGQPSSSTLGLLPALDPLLAHGQLQLLGACGAARWGGHRGSSSSSSHIADLQVRGQHTSSSRGGRAGCQAPVRLQPVGLAPPAWAEQSGSSAIGCCSRGPRLLRPPVVPQGPRARAAAAGLVALAAAAAAAGGMRGSRSDRQVGRSRYSWRGL